MRKSSKKTKITAMQNGQRIGINKNTMANTFKTVKPLLQSKKCELKWDAIFPYSINTKECKCNKAICTYKTLFNFKIAIFLFTIILKISGIIQNHRYTESFSYKDIPHSFVYNITKLEIIGVADWFMVYLTLEYYISIKTTLDY